MKLINRLTNTVTTNTFEIEIDGEKFTYTEYLNDKNRIIDVSLKNSSGDELQDDDGPDDNAAETLERIQKFVDSLESK